MKPLPRRANLFRAGFGHLEQHVISLNHFVFKPIT